MTSFSKKFERMKKKSSIYDNPVFRQIERMNYKVRIPSSEMFDRINKIALNVPSIELMQMTSKWKAYESVFKTIEIINANPLKEIIFKFEFRNYDFAKLIESFEEEEKSNDVANTIPVKKIIVDDSAQIRHILFDIYFNNEKLYKISPREFEKVVAELLYHNGFEVELTKQTKDNGFDILALKHIGNLSPIKYLVECKRYAPNRKIGVEIIRSFKEVLFTEQANKGIIVTTSYFSHEALKKQKETPYLLDYKDKDELINWVNNYYKEKNYS